MGFLVDDTVGHKFVGAENNHSAVANRRKHPLIKLIKSTINYLIMNLTYNESLINTHAPTHIHQQMDNVEIRQVTTMMIGLLYTFPCLRYTTTVHMRKADGFV